MTYSVRTLRAGQCKCLSTNQHLFVRSALVAAVKNPKGGPAQCLNANNAPTLLVSNVVINTIPKAFWRKKGF